MAERIYIRGEGDGLEPLEQESFSSEDELQRLIASHPELLDGAQMRPDDPLRWILITREQGIAENPDSGARWSIDHLIIDQNAVPTLVEVKRGSNPEVRRTIVGQMLEYAAHATLTWTAGELRREFENSSSARGVSPDEELGRLLGADGEPDADGFWQDVATNLAARRIRLLFVADQIPDVLQRIVEFLNAQMPNIEVLAVEIRQFRGGSTQTLVPRVMGRIAKASTQGAGGPRRRLTRQRFLQSFARDDARDAAARLLDAAQRSGAALGWGSWSVGIRGQCSLWPRPVSVAWLYPGPGWQGTYYFCFGTDLVDEDLPPDLRSALEGWANSFRDWEFTTSDVSGKGDSAWSVDPDTAVKHIDVLEERLTGILAKLDRL